MSNSKKYKLIKEYPGSPILGTITKGSYENYKYQVLDYPEFWQEIVEKDYEILKLALARSIKHEIRDFEGYSENYIKSLLDCKGNYIYSVKRLSDGEVFTVGDTVQYQLTTGWSRDSTSVITRFEPNGNYLDIYTTLSVSRPWATLSNSIKRIKQPLFTTEDGVDVYEGDEVYYVKDFVLSWAIIPNYYKHVDGRKYFSTKEAAEEYVLMNKPCLSINDMPLACDRYEALLELKELVKSRL